MLFSIKKNYIIISFRYIRSLPVSTPKTMEEILPDENFLKQNGACELELDRHLLICNFLRKHYFSRSLLAKMLAIDPNERYTVAQGLRDPYLRAWCKYEEAC